MESHRQVVFSWMLAVLVAAACSSKSDIGSDPPDAVINSSNPDPAAWAGYHMTFGKKQPRRPRSEDDVFFYKHCQDTGHVDIFSRVEYWCNER